MTTKTSKYSYFTLIANCLYREFKNSDIDLNAEYSDDEETIEIGEKDLIDYL